ncbi:hypothetical protein [Streptomyces flaveus]|uniref:Uncharacterized protein n=1 Tax=Streptomyces flaveus TaxID=66370 RepID=A0A917VP63_9ACTN|nr:hypothetical protein [Streptomyces flaveus]GGL00558.1 hypothetical protein GCM10010094_71460 [Streptomyces flaveus]
MYGSQTRGGDQSDQEDHAEEQPPPGLDGDPAYAPARGLTLVAWREHAEEVGHAQGDVPQGHPSLPAGGCAGGASGAGERVLRLPGVLVHALEDEEFAGAGARRGVAAVEGGQLQDRTCLAEQRRAERDGNEHEERAAHEGSLRYDGPSAASDHPGPELRLGGVGVVPPKRGDCFGHGRTDAADGEVGEEFGEVSGIGDDRRQQRAFRGGLLAGTRSVQLLPVRHKSHLS